MDNVRDTSTQDSEDKLVSRAVIDSAAFALLYDIYYESIFGYCIHRLSSRQIAEDWTGASLLLAAQTISKFHGKTRTDFANWLYAVATAQINKYLRQKLTAEKLMTKELPSQPGEVTWPVLHNAILKLKPKEQTIIVLRFFENLTAARIAEITGSSPYTIRLEIVKSLEQLKICEAEKQFEEIVKKIDIDDAPDSAHKEKLRAKLFVSFNSAKNKKPTILIYSVVVTAVVIAIFALQYHRTGKMSPLRQTIKPTPAAEDVNIVQPQKEKSRLEKIQRLAAEKNIPELLKILRGDDLTARFLAARYLAELTDSNAADIMKLTLKDFAKPDAKKDEEQKTILISITDKNTNLPLPDVSLQVSPDDGKELIQTQTDANGQYILTTLAEKLKIIAAKENYAKMIEDVNFGLPDKISFQMQRIIEVGGFARNEQFEPIEGARIKLKAFYKLGQENPYFENQQLITTDSAGQWRYEQFPADVCQAAIMAIHPDYVAQQEYRPAIIEELKAFSFVTTLEKGITVSGRVVNWENNPLKALVVRGSEGTEGSEICDANGWFHFKNILPSIEIFTVQSAGAAPQIIQIDVGPNMPPIMFHLNPANVIRARIVDVNNSPLKDVDVRVASWQGFTSLKFESRTDENGFFNWTDAPADEVLFDIYKPGYTHIDDFGMKSENDYVITLLPDTTKSQ